MVFNDAQQLEQNKLNQKADSLRLTSDMAESITRRVASQAMTHLGTTMAVEGIEAGGATVEGAAMGGGAGTVVGPEGTVIGAGVGLVVGCMVDWWLSDQFAAKTEKSCYEFLDMVEQRLKDGTEKSPGLKPALEKCVRLTDQVQRDAIVKVLKEPKP